uniref:DUF1725 domain-containing protein n=1 Tax=Rousettus aegyptiacus TaxID=9407 RepID=A0A7J8DXN9_ROUAE|nr:hypothetical protein HJG63_008428 [Rousettus aegyptiacus]
MGAAIMENSVEFPQKIKNGTTIGSSNPTSGYLSGETQNTDSRRYMHLYVHCSIIHVANIWKQPKYLSIYSWVKKIWYIYTMEYCSVLKTKEILPLVTTWVDLEGIMLSEISQTEKDKCHMISLMCRS